MGFLTSLIPNSLSEIVLIFIIFIACLLISFIFGQSRMVAFNLSFYPAILIYTQFRSYLEAPFFEKLLILGDTPNWIFIRNSAIFLFFFLITFLIINSITGKNLQYTNRKKKFRLLALSFSALILILVVVHQVVMMPDVGKHFPQIGKLIFAPKDNFVWILVGSLIITLISGRK